MKPKSSCGCITSTRTRSGEEGARLRSDTQAPAQNRDRKGALYSTPWRLPDCHTFTLAAHDVMYRRRHGIFGPKMPCATVARPTSTISRVQCPLVERSAG